MNRTLPTAIGVRRKESKHWKHIGTKDCMYLLREQFAPYGIAAIYNYYEWLPYGDNKKQANTKWYKEGGGLDENGNINDELALKRFDQHFKACEISQREEDIKAIELLLFVIFLFLLPVFILIWTNM